MLRTHYMLGHKHISKRHLREQLGNETVAKITTQALEQYFHGVPYYIAYTDIGYVRISFDRKVV